jgi:putative DNA primase/helicase
MIPTGQFKEDTLPNPYFSNIEEIERLVEEEVQREEKEFKREGDRFEAIPSADLLQALKDNQDGDARLFIRLMRDRYCFDHSIDQWLRWTGHYWEEDLIGNAVADLDSVARVYGVEAARQAILRQEAITSQRKQDAQDAEQLERELFRRIHDLRTLSRKRDVLYLSARGSDSLGIRGDEWDRDPWLLACNNGVIDLRTGNFSPGRPEDFIKTVSPTEWMNIDKEAPEWEKFLEGIFNGNLELVEYIQRLLGYSITGSTREHILPILYGEGRNGKGTLLETLKYILGSSASPIPAEMLVSEARLRSSAGPSPDIMLLRGRRLVWASETDEGRRLDIGKVKWLTGSDTLVGRPPHGKHMVEFEPTHTLFLLTNHKPVIPPHEFAMWERIHLIPFDLSYVDEPKRPNERKRDPDLPEKLREESSGILAWLIRGCLEWQRVGLNPPVIVKAATSKYKEDEDILGHFLEERTYTELTARVPAGVLYNAYKRWCEDYGYSPLGGRKFGERMGERFKKRAGAKGNFYEGIALIPDGQVEVFGDSNGYSNLIV